ncbi:cupin domain-containing protein [Ramlibacter sp. MAHUQ-53]|uniref:cupin domain-containing protein n=1 Tax=unclassified Ramlibacter TaxID=2617605 RepID=UPI003635F026
MTRDDFLAAARAEGLAEPVLVEYGSTHSLGDHSHPFGAFALVLEGEFTIEVAGRATRYAPGDTFRLATGTVHREWAGPQGARYLSARKQATTP